MAMIMGWIMKLLVLPIWLAVTLLLLFKAASNLSSVVADLAMLLGIVPGVVAASVFTAFQSFLNLTGQDATMGADSAA